jgi:GNAT superfamily N-acetyltransferase
VARRLRPDRLANLRIREAVPGDGAAIARVHNDSAAYYVGLTPDLFRLPDQDGLIAFLEPASEENSSTSLFIVADIDEEVVGHLLAKLLLPTESDRFQAPSDLSERRLYIQALSVLQSHWRRGIATALVERAEDWGRERGATVAIADTWPDSPVSFPFWRGRMGYKTRSVRMRKPLTN